ncbi:hypothetical protein A5630_25425 [Mycolicibacterium mucogenicum]|uniref:PD-(D/E)XK endonuclease-like domain-containing protein n=1 Tax=Mycolicibacterium mucogenicum TaxID=56689 RepID=A0A1A3GWU1_MYCMU|nr:PD-(D/E)XK nuclease family protein [Mycolicibacterium mucogenicum]OBJ40295.1 hypothetical protein A5630_25425 [Mycolicibacterium mucogenicum]
MKPPGHLSVSQRNTYEKCPQAWYLAKVEKAWSRPAAWLPQGSAVHYALEMWERSGRQMTMGEAQEVFKASYAEEVSKYTEVTPNFDWWQPSGPYGGEQDVERRFDIGLEQVEKCLAWYDAHPNDVVWVAPDGTPGIELGFDIDLDGVLVRGYIDAVMELEQGLSSQIIVRDNKTGNSPGDDFQLGVYGVALRLMYGLEVTHGDYFMAGKKGKPAKPTYPYDITEWTEEAVTAEFHQLHHNIKAERFDPKPDPDKCKFCDVAYSCAFSAA